MPSDPDQPWWKRPVLVGGLVLIGAVALNVVFF
jgi:hypothetical protein